MSRPDIVSADGGPFGGYLALPAGDGPAPAVIVILEIRGVNANLRAICDGYAAQGYLAVAPDLLWRIQPDLDYDPDTPAGWDLAMKIHAGFDEAKAVDDLKATLAWIRRHPRSNGIVGTVGYCLGGRLAFMMATQSDADANISYYGVGLDGLLGDLGKVTKPLVIHIADKDAFFPPEGRAAVVAATKGNSHAVSYVYPNADHAFARVNGIHWDGRSATIANGRGAEPLVKALG